MLDLVFVTLINSYLSCGSSKNKASPETFHQNIKIRGVLARLIFSALGSKIDQLLYDFITITQSTTSEVLDITCLETTQDTLESDLPASHAETHAYWRALGNMFYIRRSTSFVLLYHALAMAYKIFGLHLYCSKHLRLVMSQTLALSSDLSTTFTLENETFKPFASCNAALAKSSRIRMRFILAS